MARQVDIEQIKDKLGIGADKVYAAMGAFETPEELVKAGRKIREMGYSKLDAMTPFPVHGIDDALGIPYSFLGWIVICFSITGLSTALFLQWYTGGLQFIKMLIPFGLSPYPLVIGGKPLFDFSFSIPVDFELTVAFTALATFFGMWAHQWAAEALSSVHELSQRASRHRRPVPAGDRSRRPDLRAAQVLGPSAQRGRARGGGGDRMNKPWARSCVDCSVMGDARPRRTRRSACTRGMEAGEGAEPRTRGPPHRANSPRRWRCSRWRACRPAPAFSAIPRP